MDLNSYMSEMLKQLGNSYAILSEQLINQQLNDKVSDWNRSLKFKILKENPFLEEEKFFLHAENTTTVTLELINENLNHIILLSHKVNEPFNAIYWYDELSALKGAEQENEEKIKLLYKILIKECKKYIDKVISAWELAKIEEFRNIFLKELEDWLDMLSLLKETFDELSMETGFLWDLSKRELCKSDIALLRKWAEYIKNNESVKELCDLMGRLKRYEKSKKQETILLTNTVKEFLPDVNSKEEIVGIKLGRDLENVLPQEIVLLSDDITSILFDIKFSENRLMCFEMQGLQPVVNDIKELKTMETESDKPGGPIIVCVDTSGSMHGTPENIAKALTLVLAFRALAGKRDCLLINFSTSIETMTLTPGSIHDDLFQFLQKSFYGGTDVTPALSHALEMMNSEQFEHSDLLVISDFMMAGLNSEVTEKIRIMKPKNNRFFSLCIGELFLDDTLHDIFDGEWVYNPRTTGIDIIKQVYDIL